MKWCKECKQPIEYPHKMREDNGVGHIWITELCPFCGAIVDEADQCPWCDEPKDADELLCPACKDEFINSFCKWVEGWIPSAGTSDKVIDMVFEYFGDM